MRESSAAVSSSPVLGAAGASAQSERKPATGQNHKTARRRYDDRAKESRPKILAWSTIRRASSPQSRGRCAIIVRYWIGVSAGAALTWAITTEAVGYVVLLIPRRIREIKEEGRAEAMREWREEGRQEGRAEGRKEEAERIARLRARCERGEITLDEFFKRVSNDYCDVCCRRL